MSLLREIQNLASCSSKDIDLSSLLRKCKILSARLNHHEFKVWVEKELNGYESDEELPSYRIMKVMSKGHFSGAFGRGLRNANIPTYIVDKEYREYIEHAYLTLGIGGLESLISNSPDGIIRQVWAPELLSIWGEKFYEDMYCIEAWKVIPVATIENILNIVRNKILSFVLEIEAENPEAGDVKMNTNPIEQGKITQIFNTTIHGNVQNVATGSSDVNQNSQINNTAKEELFSNLLDIISNQKVSLEEEQYQNILKVINEMKSTQGTSDFSSKYIKFIELINSHAGIFSAIAPYIPVLTKLSGVA